MYDPTLNSKAENYRNRYQFCDIKDKEIMTQVAKGIQQHKEVDKKYGWFTMGNYKEIIRLAKVK